MNTIKKILSRETILYLIFGVLTTLLDFSIYYVLTHVSIHYLVANTIAWCIAFMFSFITNKLVVFRSRLTDSATMLNEFTGFLGARLFSLLFSLLFMYLSVTFAGMDDLIAKILASIFVVIINYIFSKLFIFNKKEETAELSFLSFVKENFAFFVSFIIPLILLVVIYYRRKIYPFGDNMYLRSDCYHQYAPFMMEFYHKIKSGGNLTFSWNIGMGVNFSSLYAYYLASPVNWLIGLVKPSHIPEIMSVFIIVKTSLSSATFSYYLSERFHTKKMMIATLSLFYALSSYFCAYSWNLMWLDCFVLLPLIVLGLERLVKENRCYLYGISLGFAILSNYYIAIMICFFCILYFLGLVYSDDAKKSFSYYFMKIRNFILYSLLAGGFAAITFLPAYFALSSTASGEFEFPKTVITYFSALFMLSRSLINVEPAIFSAHDPNLYCGVIVFLLIPLYVINPKIQSAEKIAKVSLVCFLLYSFNTNIPNYIWHGFHYPNSLPCRESFLYIFMLLSMSFESLLYLKEITRKQLYSCFAGAIGLLLLIEQLFVSDTYKATTIYISIIFLIFYMMAFSLYRSNNYKQGFVAYLLLTMITCECYINTDETAISTCTRSAYLKDNKAIAKLVDQANQTESAEDPNKFFRIEKADRRSKNDAAWSNYHGASIFSSTTNSGLSKYYGALGFEESTNAYAYYGHTPLTEAMFSIKYVLSTGTLPETDYLKLFGTEDYTRYDGKEATYRMYQNQYWLPLGFMLPADIELNWDITDPNPFSVQNGLAEAITGISSDDSPMYTRLLVNTIGTDNEVYLESDTHLFIYVTTSLDRITVDKTLPDESTTSKNYYSMTHSHMLDLGELEAGTKVTVFSSDPDVSSIQLYAYSFDKNIFLDVFEKLNKSTLTITSFADTHIEGRIDVSRAGLFYTSIPYDPGFSVYVDGRKTTTHAFKDALLCFYLDDGPHEITFDYTPKGLKSGISLTVISILIFIAIVIAEHMKKKRIAYLNTLENETE